MPSEQLRSNAHDSAIDPDFDFGEVGNQLDAIYEKDKFATCRDCAQTSEPKCTDPNACNFDELIDIWGNYAWYGTCSLGCGNRKRHCDDAGGVWTWDTADGLPPPTECIPKDCVCGAPSIPTHCDL